jgi:ubiquinone/menaquinone biosynthesis C-methylase UbiE
MSPSPKFWNKVAAKYAASPVGDEAAYQRKLGVTQSYFRPDMKVFEFGCGTGSTAIVHAPHVAHIHATDISERMIEIAQGKADAAEIENITFETLVFDAYDPPEASYDAVLGLSILHLLDDLDAAIAKVHRMLKPGGFFASSTVCLGQTMWWLWPVLKLGRLTGKVPLVKFLRIKPLEASLIRAGFRIDHKWQQGGKAAFIVAVKDA